jgi:hypothetical protein
MCDRNSCVCGTNDPEPTVEGFVLQVANSVPLPLVYGKVVDFFVFIFLIFESTLTAVTFATL